MPHFCISFLMWSTFLATFRESEHFNQEVMTSRWTFLRPWLSQLTMKYKEMDLDYDARGPPQRMIKVYLRRAGNVPEAAFQVKCSEPVRP